MVDLLPAGALHLPVAKFGNLALHDAVRLADTLTARAQEWAAPRLRFVDGLVLEPEGDDSVWVALAGDLDVLGAVGRGITHAAQGLHLFVDRRAFRPHLRVGTINDRTTERYLEDVLVALAGFRSSEWWQSTISLVVPTEPQPDGAPFRTYREVPLLGSPPS